MQFRRPDGRALLDAPRLPDVASDAVEALCEQNVNAGAHVDADTLRPEWYGERFDVGYAIDVLHPRATSASG